MSAREATRRWRLILGAGAESRATMSGLGGLRGQDAARDRALDYLYGRERGASSRERDALTPVTWLNEVRRLFPASAARTLQQTAVQRYRLVELLTDREALRSAEPSLELVATLLGFKNHLPPAVMGEVRRIVGQVVRELEQRLTRKVRQHFGARRLRHAHGGRALLANLDWHRTVRRNLKHYDETHETLILERLYFNPRDRRRLPWHLVLAVDQSGSMVDSVIYSAIIGAVFSKVPSLATRLLLFDTEVLDVTDLLDDALETLLSVQLGGGTDIANAVRAARALVARPNRTIVVLVSDFDEGGPVEELVREVRALADSGVTLLGLAALTEDSEPYFNRDVAARLGDAGMTIGAMTPDNLAAWVAERAGSG